MLAQSDGMIMSASGYSQAAVDIGFIPTSHYFSFSDCIDMLGLEYVRPDPHDCIKVGENVIEENKPHHSIAIIYNTMSKRTLINH